MLLSPDLQLSLKNGLSRGWKMLRRERQSSMTLLTVFSVVLLLQIFVVCLFAVGSVQSLLVAHGDVQLRVLTAAGDRSLQEFYAALHAQSFVDGITFNSDERAFHITLTSPNAYAALGAFIAQPAWKNVVNPDVLASVSNAESRVGSLVSVTRSIGTLLTLFIALTVVVLLLVLGGIVHRRMQNRKNEAMLEALLGASPADTLIPQATHAGMFILLSLLIAGVVVMLGLTGLPLIAGSFSGAALQLHQQVIGSLLFMGPIILLLELLLAPVVATGGAALGLKIHS
ncbi:hypothetical protein HZA45_03795 [Candidatus Peregrinibacteria bacterium]|nr:hypothetical protein [Candidatus Peregrinibacteria bacterium]